jgi:hypothetical protein
MLFYSNEILQSPESGGETPAGGAQAPASNTDNSTPTGNADPSKPHDWSNDPRVDENGNPVEQSPEGQEPEVKPDENPTQDQQQEGEDSSNEEEQPNYVPMTEDVGKQVTKLIEEAGLNAQDVAAAIYNNGKKVTPEIMKALAEKHGDAVATVLAGNLESLSRQGAQKAKANDQAVYDTVAKAFEGVTDQSGKESWNELKQWAGDNIPKAEREEINALLKQGGMAQKMAINELIDRFKSSDSFNQEVVLEQGSRVSGQGADGAPISRTEYQRMLRELESKGHVYGQSTEIAKLDRRREAGIKRGI